MSQHFVSLIKQGNLDEIRTALQADPGLAAARDAQGVSALLWSIYTRQDAIRDLLASRLTAPDIFEAAALGQCDRLQQLIAEDATRTRAVSADGWPPLHLAAAFSTPEAVMLLLESGAHVHQLSHNAMRNQPLHACIALNPSIEIARLLLDNGADVNFAQTAGFTPLHQAAASGNRELVLLLLSYGATRDALCNNGKTPAEYARERGHTGIADAINAL